MNPEKPRIRAAKACKRCSQRKVKCDAVQSGIPCSRCRMDNLDNCALIISRRGTYNRTAASQLRSRKDSPPRRPPGHPVPANHDDDREFGPTAATPISIQGSSEASPDLQSTPIGHPPTDNTTAPSMPPPEPDVLSQSSGRGASTASVSRSLSAMFEKFLSWRSQRNLGQCGLILLGEPSPLTFALEEYPQAPSQQLHDASDQIRDSTNLEVIRHDIHPPHLNAADVAYLKAKGAFTRPSEQLLDDLVSAYLTRFHSLYSIVNKVELKKLHDERKLPWMLLHAVCFIGATFCDNSVIHQHGLKSRIEARRCYYQKAKVLFDVGYETNKIILLQCSIMLSFWGPQPHSYWNPCSWIGFGVTFAVSMGIHRRASSSNAPRGDKGLLRRLWWTLVVRDTYCAVLLGRSFRINHSQCDTEILRPDDFVNETAEDAFYQTQIAHLSLLLQDIVYCRFGPGEHNLAPEMVHARMEEWRSSLQHSLQGWPNGGVPFACAIALELLYNYYVVLLYIKKPTLISCPHSSDHTRPGIVEACARMIASHAISLVTKTKVCDFPHEVFPAFFVAGIVLYRQMRQQNDLVSQMARANLDNCRVVLNEAQELWDPGNWAMEIFDFLCTNHTDSTPSVAGTPGENRRPVPISYQGDENPEPMLDKNHPSGNTQQDASFGWSWETVHGEFTGGMEDYLLMPNFLPPAADEWSGLQF